jgi:hypothetical protein
VSALAEAALIAAVLAPVALSRSVRRTFLAIDRPRQAALAAMVALTLAGQLVLSTRSFPFVDWRMYGSVAEGDAVAYEYDAVLRSGRTIALVPGRYLAPESADRMMEALRRQVERLRAAPAAPADRREHEQTLAALAGMHDDEHPGDPVAAVLVTHRTVASSSGERSDPGHLWTVRLR